VRRRRITHSDGSPAHAAIQNQYGTPAACPDLSASRITRYAKPTRNQVQGGEITAGAGRVPNLSPRWVARTREAVAAESWVKRSTLTYVTPLTDEANTDHTCLEPGSPPPVQKARRAVR